MLLKMEIKHRDTEVKARKSIGASLKALRIEKNMTAEDVAAMVGLEPRTVTAIEDGRYFAPLEKLVDIAEALDAKIKIVEK